MSWVGIVAAIGLSLGALGVSHAGEPMIYGQAGAATEPCGPGYLAMDPSAGRADTWQFPVRIEAPKRTTQVYWVYEFVFPSRVRCIEARNAVSDTLAHVFAPDIRLFVGSCE